MASPNRYDVLVVGAGPAGSSAALALVRSGFRVLITSIVKDASPRVGETLPPIANRLLRDLGVWELFTQEKQLPSFGNTSAWGVTEGQDQDFIYDCNGHGWHLDRERFDVFMRREAIRAGAEFNGNTTLRDCRYDAEQEGWIGVLSSEHPSRFVICDWLVDASGFRNGTARFTGARRKLYDRLVGISAMFSSRNGMKCDSDARTVIEADQNGWWYTALLPAGERIVTYLSDSDLIVEQSLRNPHNFVASLKRTHLIRGCMDGSDYAIMGPTRLVPAQSGRLLPPVGHRWIAVGDAAISFDPLSSQGLTNALFTGMSAAEALHKCSEGDHRALQRYEKQIDAIYSAYCHNRLTYYRLERRWADRPFWKRRHMRVRHRRTPGNVTSVSTRGV